MRTNLLIATCVGVFIATNVRLEETASAVSLPFEDGFENIAVGAYPSGNGWTALFGGKEAYVSDAFAHTGTKSFRLDSHPSWARMDYVNLNAVPDRLTYEVSIRVDPANGSSALAGFMKGVGGQGPVWNYFWVSGVTGQVEFVGLDGTRVGQYTRGTWCTLRADLDFANSKADLWMDGTLVVEDVGIRPKEFDDATWGHVVLNQWGVMSCNYSSGSSNVVYFDDVGIYESPDVGVIHVAPYCSQDETQWCGLASLAMLLGQYGCNVRYETNNGAYNEPVKPWDVAAYMGWSPGFGFHPFLVNVSPKVNGNFLEPEFGLTLEVHEYRPKELNLFWSELKSILAGGKLAMLGLSALRHAVVVSGYDEEYVYLNDPDPYGSMLYKEVTGTMPDYAEAHMVTLPRKDLSRYLRSRGAIWWLFWLEGDDPATTSGRATIWLEGKDSRCLRFTDPGNIAQETLELVWDGTKPFGYMYRPPGGGSLSVRHVRDGELGWAALPSEALRLWAVVANPEAQVRQFTVDMTITRISDGSVCFQQKSEPFQIRGRSRGFELRGVTWPRVPLLEPDDGLILQDCLPFLDLDDSPESAIGEYLLRLDLRASSGIEDWICIRFNVAEPRGHR